MEKNIREKEGWRNSKVAKGLPHETDGEFEEVDLRDTVKEDIIERLTLAEKWLEELRELVRKKDIQLQEKDEALQEEKQYAENRIKNIKLHAKAKITSLNKRIAEMKAHGVLPAEPHPVEQLPKHDVSSTEKEMEVEKIKHELQEKEQLINCLQDQLVQAKAEQGKQSNKSSAEMEEFLIMKEQLQEKEELIGTLQAQLGQIQAEQAAQLSSMQQVVREKDARFETQVRLHEDELLRLVTRADVEAEVQQKLRVLQRKLEEQEEALLSRAHVVELLQQELTTAEQRNQILSQQLQHIEAEHNALKTVVESERQESKILMEKMEFEVEQNKLSLHNQQAEAHNLLEQLEQAGQARAELQSRCNDMEIQHNVELEEKTSYILSLQKTKEELQCACDALKLENAKLLQEQHEQAVHSAQSMKELEEQLQQKSEQITQLLNKPTLQNFEMASQTFPPDVCNEGTQMSVEDIGKFDQRSFSTVESGQDILDNTFSQKHKELSTLLLEMKEAQEEIAFLKSQLQDKSCTTVSGDPEVLNQKELKETNSEGLFLEETRHHLSPIPTDDNSHPETEEKQICTTHQSRTSEELCLTDAEMELKSAKQHEFNSPPTCLPSVCQCHHDELEKLKDQILDLETSFSKAEVTYEKNLDAKAKEISSLSLQIEELKSNAEKANSAIIVLSEEKEQLLSQVKELSVITELRTQVQELEVSLAKSESQRRLDYENQTTNHNLLNEQIHSLNIEAESKDIKIGVLQSQLDDLHLQCSEQSTLITDLQNQLQKKESEVLEREEHAKSISIKVEELSQTLSQKDLEIVKIDQLLLEKNRDVETLQQVIEEKEQKVTEISFSMNEKMVQLTEEKFSLGMEIKALKEQLNSLSRAKEARKGQVADAERVSPDQPNSEELNSEVLIKSKEELQHELELVKKESEQRKRTLHAALVSRKELLQKVTRLEEELAKLKDDSQSKILTSEIEKREVEGDKENKEDSEKCMTSKCQEMKISLKQTLSKKERELEDIRKDLEERLATEEQLQALVKDMSQKLQEKMNQIDLLQAEIVENQELVKKLMGGSNDAGDRGLAAPTTVSPVQGGSGEPQQHEMEAKTMNLEKEKEQLEKKLQEVVGSHKVVHTNAQEKENHLREELKQQKDDYNHFQEQFDMQSKENENIELQLKQHQIQVRESTDTKVLGTEQEPGLPTQAIEEPLLKDTEQQLAQPVLESSLCPGWPHSADANTLQDNNLTVQIKELELKLSSTTSELTKKSAEVFQLQDQLTKQCLEIQSLKVAGEAQNQSLREELESCQLEMTELAHLRKLQPELDELQKLICKKEEETRFLSGQLSGKEATLTQMQSEIMEQEALIKALHTQLEMQAKEHNEKIKQLEVELCEMKEKLDNNVEESKEKQQMQRKLQAALISRKQLLKENKNLQEELSLARETIEHLTRSLAGAENQVTAQNKEKDTFLENLALLQEEKGKVTEELQRSLTENQSLNDSCESLKLALESVTEDKEKLVKELEALKCSKVAESTEWQEKHEELKKEYEILLQSYENACNQAERVQHVVEKVRQEKEGLYATLRNTEVSKKETEKQLQEAEKEMEDLKEKMRKFAKSKQNKIVELEEENDLLRAEVFPGGGCIESLRASNSCMKEELERVKVEYESLSKEFKALLTEKDSLSEVVQDLKHQIEINVSQSINLEATEKCNKVDIIEEVIQPALDEAGEQGSLNINTRSENLDFVPPENSTIPSISENSSHEIYYLQEIDHFKEKIANLEKEKKKQAELSQMLENERNTLLNQIAEKDSDLKMLQEEVIQINLLNQQTQEELARVTKLKNTVEEEKDDLEERLMNQLAELNGSIGNYYQDVTDAQIKNEQLESEMQSLKKCMSELEEEKEQLVKEKTQVESKIRKECLEKIQGAQKEPVSQGHAKELKELLKEKQHEVKQLQKDCIRYQEKISTLERTVKALEFVQTESQKDLEITKEKLAQANERCKKGETELASSRVLLDDIQSEAARVLADHLKLKKELDSIKVSVKSQMKEKDEELERRLEQAEEKHLKEKKNMQEKLDGLHLEKAHLEETFGEIQNTLNQKDRDIKQLQENLDNSVTQLAAFTRSMSSLQDDRDRLIDEAKTWEKKFTNAIQAKEEENRLKDENCSFLKDQLKQMSIHMEELKINISRLEHDEQTWEYKTKTEVQLQQKVCATLQEENKGLLSQLEEMQELYHKSQNELAKWESEFKILKDQTSDLNNSLEKCKEDKEHLEGIIKQQETDIQNSKFSYEQLETDLQASKELISQLNEEINMKEQKIISLLSDKECAIKIAITELHQQHDKEIKELINLLSHEEGNSVLDEENKTVHKADQLREALKAIKNENIQQKTQLNSFVKSISSLQDDRDRIVGDYQKLEERHLSVIVEKDDLIQDAANENNKLKEEIRCLRSHMDDLNSENAKLDAELIQYKKDLNQMITGNYCQQNQLLDAQLQQNQELKIEYAKLGEKLKESEQAKEDLLASSLSLQEEKQGLSKEIENLQLSISQLKSQGALGIVQAQLNTKEGEVQRLNSMLSSSKKRIEKLEEELVQVQKEADKKIVEVEDKLKKELKHLHHDAGIMRNETETAEERVAELAKDLMEMEQKLLVVTKENKDLTAQIQSFGNSMNSLQNSRDKTKEEFDELKKKYDASLKELAQLRETRHILNRERDVLVSKTITPTHTTEDSTFPHLEKLNQQLLSKDEQFVYLSSKLEESYNQVQSFSKAVASLQNERDLLLNELEKFHKSKDGKQKSAAEPTMSPAEVQSLKKAMSSLQNDRDRLLKELKNLQQQYLEITQEITDLRPLKTQLQEYQDQLKTCQILQEELRQENLSWQQELHQLRTEKSSLELHESQMKEQYFLAISEKDQQLSHLQNLIRELRASSTPVYPLKVQYQRQVSQDMSASLDGPQNLIYESELLRTQLNDSLKEMHQKEIRIQQLNSKFSQLLEEKNTLSIQLCDTSQNLRESQQRYSNLFNHCAFLEKQVQELKVGSSERGITPGDPQDKNGAHKKSDLEDLRDPSQRSFAEAQQQLCRTKQEINELRKLLEEEHEQRVAAEAALSMAEEQLRRLEHTEYFSAQDPLIGPSGTDEHTVLIDCTNIRSQRTHRSAGWKRILHSLFHSRNRVPMLATIYILIIHALLILCLRAIYK